MKKPVTTNKALIYGRVSTEKQDNSQEVQETKCREYCKLYNLEVSDIIIEEGISGKVPLFNRPGGRKIKDMDISHVVIYKLDRAFRNVSDALITMEYFKEKNISVHIVAYGGMSINTDSAVGKFIFTTLSAIAELERGMISERTTEGLASLKRNGKRHSGQVPAGCIVEKIQIGTKDGKPVYDQKFIPDPHFDKTKKIIAENRDKSLRKIKSMLPMPISIGTINNIRALL